MVDAGNLHDKNRDELISLLAESQSIIAESQSKLSVTKNELSTNKKALEETSETLIVKTEALKEKEINVSKLQEDLRAKESLIAQQAEIIRLLKHARYAALSERFTDSSKQGCLFDEAELPDNQAEIEQADEEITVPAHQRKKTGRKPLSKDLPREQVIHDLLPEEKICECGCELTEIKPETSEQLDIVPAKIIVIQHVCKKYACKSCEDTIKTAKKPVQPIPKSIASPGLLAHVLTSKFQYHLPLYRQEQILNAIGADIARKTLSLWVIRCAQLLQPLVNLLRDDILKYPVAYADETTLQVLKENGKTAQSKSYIWAFGGGPPNKRCYLYQYHPGRGHKIAVDFFKEFEGFVHCDGYQAYDTLSVANPHVRQVGCWYHVRRKFFEAAKVSKKPGEAAWFIKQIRRLANLESKLKEQALPAEEIKKQRQECAKPIVDKIKNKLDKLIGKTPAEGLLGKAISYTLKQWPKLLVYLDDGRLEISNNHMERAMKSFAVGRKNWLFANSADGAHAAANIFSLIETCKANEVNPYDWLRHVLTKLPACQSDEECQALMPFNFDSKRKSG